MRKIALIWIVVFSVFACEGQQGPKGDPGDTGPQGPSGTFSGNFSGNAQFSGPTTLNGTTTFAGNAQFNGNVSTYGLLSVGSAYNVWFSESEALNLSNGGDPTNGAEISDPDASGGQATSLVNAVRFGPYRSLPPGNYRYVTRLKVTSLADPALGIVVDAHSVAAGRNFAAQTISAQQFGAANVWQTFSLPFSLPAGVTDLEVRTVNSNNVAAFKVIEDYVMIVPDMGVSL